MKLSKWAKDNGIKYRTAYNWHLAGKIPNSRQLPSGSIVVDEPDISMEGLVDKVLEILKSRKDIVMELLK